MQTEKIKLPKVLNFRKAKTVRYGIVYYATVQSLSRPQKVNHTVTVTKRGKSLIFGCTCENGTFRRTSRNKCLHIQAVKGRL